MRFGMGLSMKLCGLVVVMLAGCTLIGCVSEQEQHQKTVAKNLDPMVGQSIAVVAGQWGPPQDTIDLGPNKKMFQWVKTSQTPGFAVPINGMMVARGPQTAECRYPLRRPLPAQMRHWLIGLSLATSGTAHRARA